MVFLLYDDLHFLFLLGIIIQLYPSTNIYDQRKFLMTIQYYEDDSFNL